MNTLLMRFARFKDQLVTLWHAFRHPSTPLYLKALMIAVVVYLFSPIDFVPDVFPVIGWLDDALIVAFAVNWIISQLPEEVFGSQSVEEGEAHRAQDQRQSFSHTKKDDEKTIEGTVRRL